MSAADKQTPSTAKPRGWNLRRGITLVCPGCGKKQAGSRDPTDPPRTAVVTIICPDCDDGDFHEASYFDAAGAQIDLNGRPM